MELQGNEYGKSWASVAAARDAISFGVSAGSIFVAAMVVIVLSENLFLMPDLYLICISLAAS